MTYSIEKDRQTATFPVVDHSGTTTEAVSTVMQTYIFSNTFIQRAPPWIFWPVLISHPTRGMRLSWPMCLDLGWYQNRH